MPEAAAYVVAAGNAHTHAMETATAEMADTYDAVVETHAVINDAPPGTHATAEAVAKFMVAAIVQTVGMAVIAVIILARRDAAVSRVVYETGRTRVGLRGSRLRSGERNRGQPNGGSQHHRFGGKPAARHRSLLWGFAQQFKLILKWVIDGPLAMGE